MKNKLKVFFSWQTSSKTDKLNNKQFILSCIEKAASEVKGTGELKNVSFEILEGTGGEPGSPDMIATCLKRNDDCHIFIADISVDKKYNRIQRWVNSKPDLRERPNENVMYELGRADGHLNYKQVIQVANTVFGDVSENDYLRPADIRPKRRPITFCLSANDSPEADDVRNQLIEDLKKAIRSSAVAALEHIYEELKPFDNCEQAAKELKFKRDFIFNESLKGKRQAIAENKGIQRVLGVNGVGKTRLVLETILQEQSDEPKLYCDCLLSTEERVLDTTTKIFEKQVSAIIILDNCEPGLFEKLLKIYQRKNARNLVYAIYENPSEKVREGNYGVVYFDYAYEDVVDGIIASLYGKQDEVSTRIKEFASGNPLMAVQAIEGVKKNGDIRDFNNRKLIANLLSAPEGSDERVIAETLSLFASIGYVGKAHKEIVAIATNKNITGLTGDDIVLVNKFDALIKQYLERGLMQRVGDFVRFKSSAVSKVLAEEWFEKCTATQLENIIVTLANAGMAGNLVPPFFEKTSQMENSRVKDLMKALLQPGKMMMSRDFLNTEVVLKIYRSLVEVLPDIVADSLFLSLGGLDLNDLKKIREGRRELVWTLEQLCYKPETFDKAAKLLLRLGCAENEHISNNATGQFVSLFPVRLPATSVPLSERLDFLSAEMKSQEEKPVLMKALGRALCTTNFIRFGGDVTLEGKKYSCYEPTTIEEESYISGCLDLVQAEIDGNTAYKEECIKMMASNFRALISYSLFDLIMPRVENVAVQKNYKWDDLLHVLHYAKRDREIKYDAQRKERVEKLILLMSKTDFVSRFSQVESYESNDYWGMPEMEHTKVVNEKYEALAVEMAAQKLYDDEILKGIYQAQTFLPQAFAIKLASLNTPEEQLKFAGRSIDILESVANSIFVYYVKEIGEDIFAKIVSLIYEKGKQWMLYPIVAVRNYDFSHPYVEKLIEQVEQKTVDKSLFVTYWDHLRIDRLTTDEAVGFLERLLGLPGMFEVVLHMVMSQYLGKGQRNPKMDSLMENEMKRQAGRVAELIVNPHYSHILSSLLSSGKKDDLAKALSKGVFEYIATSEYTSLSYEVERVVQVLLELFFDVSWKDLSGLMSTKDDEESFVKFYYAFGFSALHNPYPELIFKKENLQKIMDWCGQHPDVRAYRLMALAPLLNGDRLSEAVMILIDNYGSDKLVRAALSDKLGSFSGPASTYEARAKLIEPLTKHKNPDVSSWAILEIGRLKYYEEQSQRWEDNLMIPGRLPGYQWTLNDEDDEA